MKCQPPNVTVVKGYKPQDSQVHVHQTRVTPCPKEFPAGYCWYGHSSKSKDYVSEWVNQMLSGEQNVDNSAKITQSGNEREARETEETLSEANLM